MATTAEPEIKRPGAGDCGQGCTSCSDADDDVVGRSEDDRNEGETNALATEKTDKTLKAAPRIAGGVAATFDIAGVVSRWQSFGDHTEE